MRRPALMRSWTLTDHKSESKNEKLGTVVGRSSSRVGLLLVVVSWRSPVLTRAHRHPVRHRSACCCCCCCGYCGRQSISSVSAVCIARCRCRRPSFVGRCSPRAPTITPLPLPPARQSPSPLRSLGLITTQLHVASHPVRLTATHAAGWHADCRNAEWRS